MYNMYHIVIEICMFVCYMYYNMLSQSKIDVFVSKHFLFPCLFFICFFIFK